VTAVGSYSFTNVQANHTIHATFSQPSYTITVDAGSNGSITPGTQSVTCGGTQTFAIDAATGYHIVDVTVDGSSQGAVAGYTFTNVRATHTIAATFARTTFAITATAGGGGGIAPSGSVPVGQGDAKTFTITPDDCYAIADVTVDGTSVTAVGSYTFLNVQATHTIHATFLQKTYTIAVDAGTNGSITPSGPETVNCGAERAFAIAANTGYHIVDVLVDGTSVTAVAGYTFTNVTADHTIAASFAINPVAITLTAAQRRTGNGTGGTCTIDLSWPALPDGSELEIFRGSYGGYPGYGTGGSPAPLPVPATTYPPAPLRWTSIVADLTGVSSYADTPDGRDYYYYVAYVTDGLGYRSPVSNLAGAPDYFLGDVTNGSDAGAGDNKVDGADISLLGGHYGESGAAISLFKYLDVGPTTTGWWDGLPLTDDIIEFEDLVIFALNFANMSAPQTSARPVASAVTGSDAIVLERPEKVALGEPVTATLTLQGSGVLRALSTKLAWDAAVVEPVGHAAGEWLKGQGGVAFSAKPGMVDAAVLRAAGLSGEGLLATVTFKVLSAGDPKIRIEALDGRDAGNQKITVAQSERLLALKLPALPTVTQLAFAQPNPFRGEATLAFSLAQRGAVELAIYSVDGRRVRTLVSGVREPGEYRQGWNGRDDQGNPMSAGVYYAHFASGKVRMTRSIVYLR